MRHYPRVWFALILFMLPVLLLVCDAVLAAEESLGFASSGSLSITRLVSALVGVLVLIAVLFVLLRRFNILPANGSGAVSVITSLPLNNRDRLVLVQVGEEQILLGLSPGQIRQLHVLEKPLQAAQLSAGTKRTSESFASVLRAITKDGKP